MSIIRALCLRGLFLLCLLLGFCAFLVMTNPGLKLTLQVVNAFVPGKIVTENLEGSLWQNLAFKKLSYVHKQQKISIHNAKVNWHVVKYYPLHIMLDGLRVEKVHLAEKDDLVKIHEISLHGGYKDNIFLNGKTKVILPQGVLKVDLIARDKHLESNLTLDNNRVRITGPFNGPWQIHASLPKMSRLHESLTNLEASLLADATIYDLEHILFKANLSSGRYRLPNESRDIAFKGMSLHSELKSRTLTVKGFSELDNNTSASVDLNFINFVPAELDLATQQVSGKVKVSINSLDFVDGSYDLGDFILNLENPRGSLKAAVDISGVLNKPKLVGGLSLENASLSLPDLGLKLNPIELDFKTDGKTWQTNAQIKSNDRNALQLKGQGSLLPKIAGELVIDGDHVVVMNTAEYSVKASPHITCSVEDSAYKIAGSIIIPEARVRPASFKNTVSLTNDAVFEIDKKDPNPLNLNMDIVVATGDDVKLDVKDLHGFLDGRVQVKQMPKQALSLNGKLNLRDGKYESYGQKLQIEQGEVIFLGKQITNPNIQVRAIRKFSDLNYKVSGSNKLLDFSEQNLDTADFGDHTIVGIIVSGRVNSPKVKLFSSPPNLSQQDILSLLMFGKPADQVGSSGGQLLFKAMQSMNIGSDSKTLEKMRSLKEKYGFDVQVHNKSLGTSKGDISKTSVSVGKSITKRIYLQYREGLFQENSGVFAISYLLNKYLSVKISSSDVANGIDFTYSHSD